MSFAPSDKQLATSGILSFAIKVVGAAISFAMIVIFARILSVEEYGQFASGLNSAIIIANFAMFGLQTGILRYWPKYLVEGDFERAKGVVWLAYILIISAGLFLLVFAIALAFMLRHLGFDLNVQFFGIVALLGLLVAVADYSTNLLRAQGSTFVSMLPRDIIWRSFTPAIAFIMLHNGLHISASVSLLISASVLLMLNVWQFLTILKYVKIQTGQATARIDLKDIRRSLLPIWFSAILIAMIQQFDVVIINSVLGGAEAGAYFAAQKTAQLLSLVLIAGGLVAAPAMSSLYHADKREELQSLCRKLALAIAAATFVGYIVLAVLGKLLLGLFDASYISAYPILLVVGAGAVIDALAGPNAYLMQMTRFEVPYLKVMAGCYTLVVCAQLVLIPIWGSLGAAVASAGGVILWNVLAIYILRKRAGLDPSVLSLIRAPKPTLDKK